MPPLREVARRRWFRVLAIVVVGALPAWIVLCNLLLWTGAIAAIVTRDGKTSTVRLDHGFAWMLWPTRVHLHDVELDIDSYSYQLALRVEEATVDLRLVALLQRRLHMQEIDAENARVQYRIKVEPDDADAPELAAYAPFDGTPPQVRPLAPKPLPPPERAWSVDLDDVDAEVTRAWIDEFDLEPLGRVHGAIHWTNGGPLSVPTTTITLADTSLWLGEREAARGLTGDARLTLAPLDSGTVGGAQILDYLSFAVEAEGELVDADAFAVWRPQLAAQLDAVPGPITIDVEATDGRLAVGSRVHHRSDRVGFGSLRLRVRGAAELVLEIDEGGRARALARLRGASLRGDPGGLLAHGDEVRGELVTTHAQLGRPFAILRARVETGPVRADDLRRISAAIGSTDVQLRRGRAHGSAVAEVGPELIPRARFEVEVDDGVLAAGPVELRADLRSSGRIHRTRDGELVAEDLALRSRGVTLRSPGGTSKDTAVRLTGGTLRLAGDRLTIETRARLEDARPAVVHLTRLDPLLRALPDLPGGVPVELRGRLTVRGGTIEIDVIEARQLALEVAAVWLKHGDDWRVAVLASGVTALGFTTSDEEKLGRLTVMVGRKWLEEQTRWVRALGKRREAAAY